MSYHAIEDAAAASWVPRLGAGTLAQADGAKQLAPQAGIFGALPGLKGSGAGTQLMATANYAAAIAQPCTLLWVYKGIDTTTRVLIGASDLGPSVRSTRNAIPYNGLTVFYNGNSLQGAHPQDANPYVWTAIADGASSKLYLDALELASGDAGAGTMENLAVGNTFGNAPVGWYGDIMVIKGASATDAGALAKAREFMSARHCRSGLVVCEGDSLTNGGTYETSYPCYLLLSANYRVYNSGVWGSYLRSGEALSMIDSAPTDVDPYLLQPQPWRACVLWGGTNDLQPGANTPAQVYANIEAYCAARRSAGWAKIVVCTLTYRGDAGGPSNATIDTLNALIKANASGAADAIADVGAIPDLADPTNATFFLADKLHLTAAGYQLVAPVVKAAIATVTP